MKNPFTIKDLTNFFSAHQHKFNRYLQKFTSKFSVSKRQKNSLQPISKENSFVATVPNLLKFIICSKITTLNKELNKNLSLQFTRRTKLKQQKDRTQFEQLPEIVKNKYNNFGNKILKWLTTEFISPKLNKIIIDRLPEDKVKKQQVNFRITFYKQNHPKDLNLKITNRINNLKEINLKQLIKWLSRTTDTNLTNLTLTPDNKGNILKKLQQSLTQLNDKKTIQKLFKYLIGSKPYYLIIAEPEPIIADFTKLKLPTDFQITYENQKLIADFNNDYHLIAEIAFEDKTPYLVVDFQTLPNKLELFSF